MRHIKSNKHEQIRYKKIYKVKITGPDFTIKTERGMTPSGDAGGVRTLEYNWSISDDP